MAFLSVQRVDRRNMSSTISNKLSALRSQFERRGLTSPTLGRRISIFMRGVKNEDAESGKSHRKLPVSRRHLICVHEHLDPASVRDAALWAVMMLGWFFLLRAKNLVCREDGFDPQFIICRKDISFSIEGKPVTLTKANAHLIDRMDLFVRKSKTDQKGVGFSRWHSRTKHTVICPVKAVIRLLLLFPSSDPDLPISAFESTCLPHRRGQPIITRRVLAEALKSAGQRLGEDPRDYASHSLRIGGTTALALLKVPDHIIMKLGNWTSTAYLRYCRLVRDSFQDLADLMASSSLSDFLAVSETSHGA